MKARWWHRFRKDTDEGYQPTGDSVSWEVAMSQAVTALDHSAKLAIKRKSSPAMREVAVGWIAIANTISEGLAQSEGEEHDLDSSDNNDIYPLGFRGPSPVEQDIEEEEEEVVEDEFRTHHTFPTSRVDRSGRRFR